MKNKEKTELITLTDKVMDGIDYFESGRLSELKTDDVYYIKAFIKMIGALSSKLKAEL
jgi:hypothetical protein